MILYKPCVTRVGVVLVLLVHFVNAVLLMMSSLLMFCDVLFRFTFFIHQDLQEGKCLESGKHTNISKQQH